ncbi:MAG: hypothetical protein IT338_14585 [Thermomicrobiales bacterium]|nr:hypothetical protein [Thermomicrobiales bacterium]
MQHSVFDLEIHTKTIQGELRRDAARARLLDEAMGREPSRPFRPLHLLQRAIAAMCCQLEGGRASRRQTRAPGVEAGCPAPVASRQAPARAAEPYTAMRVIARASARPTAEQPSWSCDR